MSDSVTANSCVRSLGASVSTPISPAQSARLTKLLLETEQHVPLYRDRWGESGCRISQMSFPSDFSRLPILGKADFLGVPTRQRLDDRYQTANLVSEHTSGSTGEPFTMYFHRTAWIKRRLQFLRALLGSGYRPGQSLMLISSRHSVSLMRLARWRYIGLDRGENELWTRYQKIEPSVLYGPLSSLLLLAQQAVGSGQRYHRPRLIVSTAEQLTGATRAHLEQVFGANVTDFYGSTELGFVAWRGSRDSHYIHRDTDLLMEFIPIEHESSLERLVVTDMSGGPMPLIRFDTGDLVQRSSVTPHAPIKAFVGRRVDCLVMPDHSRISPYQITMSLEEIRELERYEVIQRADYNIDVAFWSSSADSLGIARRVQERVAHVCNSQVSVMAHHSTEQLALTGRKIRPVRSEVLLPT